MTDLELIQKKLAFIVRCLRELETEARLERIETDVREERFVVHSLQLAIQASLDVAFHIISDEALGEPRTNREAFVLLGRHRVITPELAVRLEQMAGFRNIVVHGYETVDLRIVRDVVEHRLEDLTAFVRAVDAFASSSEPGAAPRPKS